MRLIDLTGKVFSRLTVIERAENTRKGESVWRCVCTCGKECIVRGDHLRSGAIRSCGCLRNNKFGVKNLDSHSPMVHTYMNMIYRCHSPNNINFHRYGGRGIRVCKEWFDFKNFEKWMKDHHWRVGMEIDRIGNDKGYTPENCRIVSRKANMRNTSCNHKVKFRGKMRCLAEIAELSNLSYDTVYARMRYGWQSERLGDPLRFIRKKPLKPLTES